MNVRIAAEVTGVVTRFVSRDRIVASREGAL